VLSGALTRAPTIAITTKELSGSSGELMKLKENSSNTGAAGTQNGLDNSES